MLFGRPGAPDVLFLLSGQAGATAKTPAPGAADVEEENLMKNLGKWMFALSIGVF
jgi:hypothetical protein